MRVSFFEEINSKGRASNYLNFIIKPLQSLIKQEKQLLISDNNELRRNNEDLDSRIDQMMLEFDINPEFNNRSFENYHNAASQVEFPYQKGLNKTQNVNKASKPDINIEREISVNTKVNGFLLQANPQRNDKEIDYNTKKNERLSTDINSDYQRILSSSQCTSPLYLDIFDNKEKAINYFNNHKEPNSNGKSLNKSRDFIQEPIYSVISPFEKMSGHNNSERQEQSQNTKQKNPKFNVSEEVNQELKILRKEFNEKFAELNSNLSKNMFLTSDLKDDSLLPISQNSKKHKLSTENKVPSNDDENKAIHQKFDEQNLKIDNLVDKLSLLIKTNDMLNNSQLLQDMGKDQPQNIDVQDSIIQPVKIENSIETKKQSFPELSNNELSVMEKEKQNKTQIMSKSRSVTNKLNEIDSALIDDMSSFSLADDSIRLSRQSFGVVRRGSSMRVTKSEKLTEMDEKTISNDLESSYETLYDPVLSSRVVPNDDSIIYF